MSARFGRNKRRAARELIGKMQGALDQAQKNVEHFHRLQANHESQIQHLTDFEERVTDIVGHLCIIHDVPYDVGTKESFGGEIRFAPPRYDFSFRLDSKPRLTARMETLKVLSSEVIKDSLAKMSHVSACIGNERAYCITKESILQAPAHIICRKIADILTAQLYSNFVIADKKS